MCAATPPRWTRRAFLAAGAAATGGLVVGVSFFRCDDVGDRPDPGSAPAPGTPLGAYVEVHADGQVTVSAPVPEIGQGVRTALPMIVAEELGVAWERVRVVQAPAGAGSAERFGGMSAAGSDSVRDYWEPLRTAGAAARVMLVTAAAQRWGVTAAECVARDGIVVHSERRLSLGYGELVAAAARLPIPTDPPLTDPADFRIIGTPRAAVDGPAIVTGRAVFGLDVRVPGRRVATVARCPVVGGSLRRFDARAALAAPGVEAVFEIEPVAPRGILYGAVRPGIAIVATNTWSAIRGRDALEVEWNGGPNASLETVTIRRDLGAATRGDGKVVLRDQGNAPGVIAAAARRIEADYELPLLPHVTLEPMNFTARAGPDACEAWGPVQNPLLLQALIADALGIDDARVVIHPTRAGGGFGRRLAVDYGVEAALVSRAAGGIPVQVVWTREDDFAFDYLRPPAHHRLEGALDPSGAPVAWRHRLATGSLHEHLRGAEGVPPELYDVQGAADLPFRIPNIRVEYTPVDIGLRLGSWRSVAHSFNAFAVSGFLDELAAAGGRDPLESLLALTGSGPRVEIPLPLPGRRGAVSFEPRRMQRVLEVVAERAGWNGPRLADGRGIAACFYKESYAATVADVSIEAGGRARVRRIVTALDCGIIVNPSGVEHQIVGAALDGVGTALHWGMPVTRGRPEVTSLARYPMPRIDEAPEVVPVVVGEDAPPAGSGEPPYPAVPAAIVHAVHDATGARHRRLPLPAPFGRGLAGA